MTWIDDHYPHAVGKYQITSEASLGYDCIAWALGQNDQIYDYRPGYLWPSSRRDDRVESVVEIFEVCGFAGCADGNFESGWLKIVIYARNGMFKHVARLHDDGSRWLSKLGYDEDIEHETPEALCGSSYGQVHCYMKRSISLAPASKTGTAQS